MARKEIMLVRYAKLIVLISALGGVCGLIASSAFASGGTIMQSGVIERRAPVLSEAGFPIFVEYAADGSIVPGWQEERGGDYAHDLVMSADTYRTYVKAFDDYKSANQNGLARGLIVYSADTYNGFVAAGGMPGLTSAQKLPTPPLQSGSKSVAVCAPEVCPVVLGPRGVILMEAPIDLSQAQHLADNIRSVLLTDDGQIRRASQYDIGIRTAYLAPADADLNSDNNPVGKPGQLLLGPVSGSTVTSGFSTVPAISGSDGKFSMPIYIPPCPGMELPYVYSLLIAVPFEKFNPAHQNSFGHHYVGTNQLTVNCVGYGEDGITGGASAAAISSTTNLMTVPYAHVAVNLTEFSGYGAFANVTNGPVTSDEKLSVGTTVYDESAPPLDLMNSSDENLDYNADHNPDTVAPAGATNGTGAADAYSVWLSKPPSSAPTSATASSAPDLQRVADYKPDFSDYGLLKSVSQEDMKKTDLYVFRMSTGDKIAELSALPDTAIDIVSGEFAFNVAIPTGPSTGSNVATQTQAWQMDLPNAGQSGKADSLRPGEPVEIVAVNRMTGYIGTAITSIEDFDGKGQVTVPQIVLGPPNLKMEVVRAYTRPTGNETHLVGYQGSAVDNDTYVVLRTSWFDRDGSPLPARLDGYTGRIAKVGANNSLTTVAGSSSGASNALSQFSIAPGTNTQVVMLKGTQLTTDHFYVQVSGSPSYDEQSFAAGNGSGSLLSYRPTHYVPVRVPVFDETATNELRNETLYSGGDISTVTPAYQWPYRPEMQFSVVDLLLKTLVVDFKDGSAPLTIDLTSSSAADILSALLSPNAQDVILSYKLGGSQYDLLPPAGAPPLQYVFALGGDEHLATVNADGTITFSELGSLSEVSGSDLLALSLYDNSDPSNVLWETTAAPIYIETTDPDFPDVALNWNDYYPTLGEKTVTVLSDLDPTKYPNLKVQAQVVSPQGAGDVYLKGDGGQQQSTVTSTLVAAGGQYRARFAISAQSLLPSASDRIEIKFTLVAPGSPGDGVNFTTAWFVKDNSNTSFADVLAGKAVFAMDAPDVQDQGISDASAQKFDYVQELLNQVIPRKRTVKPGDAIAPSAATYKYVEENGIYDNDTKLAVQLFKQQFNLDNITVNSSKNTFQKLLKDYSGPKTDQSDWANKIIDKETLVGKQQSSSDTAINASINGGDTGLYELYANVVQPFINAMMAQAQDYASDKVTENWVARTDEGAGKTSKSAHGPGMSYCYDCKDTIAAFNSHVVECKADASQSSYTGNTSIQKDASGNVPLDKGGNPTCSVGTGTGKWAGLREDEFKSRGSKPQFNPLYWAGTDCSGLVENSLAIAHETAHRVDLKGTETWSMDAVGHINSGKLFDDQYVFHLSRVTGDRSAQIAQQELLRKGDLVQYDEHVSMVFSDKANSDGTYEVIHAFGNRLSRISGSDVFTRKVVVTPNFISNAGDNFNNPQGYGRIRLW